MIPRRARQRSNVVTNKSLFPERLVYGPKNKSLSPERPMYGPKNKSLSPEKPINVDNQQLMLNAITHNDVNLANTLLNTVWIDLDESIVWAVKNNNLEITELLIQSGADINAVYNTKSLLINAINNDNTDLAELLILYGADINTIYYNNITPIGAAIKKKNNKIVNLLLSLGAYHDSIFNTIMSHDLKTTKLLLEGGADPNIQDKLGNTPLMSTANIEIIKLLLEYGADPNIQNNYGNTPLMYTNNTEIIELLFEYGANPNIQNTDGTTALIYTNNTEIVKLLLKYGADPNIQDNNGTTLIMISGNIEITKLLLEYGADPNIQNNYGEVALELVSYDVGLLLLKAGVSIYKNGHIIITRRQNLNKIIENIHDANTAHMIGKKIFSVNNEYDPSFNYYLRKQLSKYL